MSKRCAKCEKTVYPLEELKCLDKVWHKACFRCWECNMALNMKTYKGYDKKPYCNAHYPTTRFTAVAETPEMSRITQNTKMQSQVQYHEEFEKSKGKFTVVDDDPETLRIRQNTQIQSAISYHDDFEKTRGKYSFVADDLEMARQRQLQNEISMAKYHEDFEKNIKGSKIQVADDPETLRIKANTNAISGAEYKGHREKANDMEARRTSLKQDEDIARENPKRISGYDPTKVGGMRMMAPAAEPAANPSPYSNKNVGHSTVYSSQGKVEQSGNKRVGSIADYDPLNEKFGSLQQGYYPASTTSQTQQWEETIPQPMPQNHNNPNQPTHYPPRADPPAQHRPPSPDPPHHQYQAPEPSYNPPTQEYAPRDSHDRRYQEEQHYPAPQHGMPTHPTPVPVAQPAPQPTPPQPAAPQPQPPKVVSSGPVYQAMYDYEAQDEDEVGFVDGDLIIDCQPIDEGWMFGTIRRTGQRGMLPANYVEQMQ